jgi:hypothetical protein
MRVANLALRFLLELALLGALAAWGFRAAEGTVASLALGLGAPLAAAVLWGAFVAPKAPRRLDDPWRLVLEVALFGTGVAALAAAGAPPLGAAFGLVVAANLVAMVAFGQRSEA